MTDLREQALDALTAHIARLAARGHDALVAALETEEGEAAYLAVTIAALEREYEDNRMDFGVPA